jgi:hypothetical protein
VVPALRGTAEVFPKPLRASHYLVATVRVLRTVPISAYGPLRREKIYEEIVGLKLKEKYAGAVI